MVEKVAFYVCSKEQDGEVVEVESVEVVESVSGEQVSYVGERDNDGDGLGATPSTEGTRDEVPRVCRDGARAQQRLEGNMKQ